MPPPLRPTLSLLKRVYPPISNSALKSLSTQLAQVSVTAIISYLLDAINALNSSNLLRRLLALVYNTCMLVF